MAVFHGPVLSSIGGYERKCSLSLLSSRLSKKQVAYIGKQSHFSQTYLPVFINV